MSHMMWVSARLARSRGAVIIMVATAMVALLGFAALAVDGAYLLEVKSELQNVSDATALAAASGLSETDEQVKHDTALARGVTYANKNTVLGQPLNLQVATAPIDVGRWNAISKTFENGAVPANAVRVTLQTGVTAPAIPGLFFAPVLGHTVATVKADAIATFNRREPIKIMFVLDRSDTMIQDPSGSPPPPLSALLPRPCTQEPLCDVTNATLNFLPQFEQNTVNGDALGLVSFSSDGFPPICPSSGCPFGLPSPLSPDRLSQQLTPGSFFTSLPSVNTAFQNYGNFGVAQGLFLNTNLASGVCYAQQQLPSVGNSVPRVIVVLSDGRANGINADPPPLGNSYTLNSNCTGNYQPPPVPGPSYTSYNPTAAQVALDQANAAKASGIIIHTITYGQNAQLNTVDGVAGDQLLLHMANGQHFKASSGDDVLKIFTELFIEPGLALVE